MKRDVAMTVESAQTEVVESPLVMLSLVFSNFELADHLYCQVASPDLQEQNRRKVDFGSILTSRFIKDPVRPVRFVCGNESRDDKMIAYVAMWMSDSTFKSRCGDYVDGHYSWEQVPRMSPGFLKTVKALVALGYAIDPEMGCMFDREILLLNQPKWWRVYGRFVTHRGMQKWMPGLVAESDNAASQPIAEFIKDFDASEG